MFRGHSGTVWQCAFLDDDTVVSGGDDGTVRLWSIESGEQRFAFVGDPRTACAVAYCPQRQILAGGSREHGQVYFWHAADPKDIQRLRVKAQAFLAVD